MYLLLGVVTWLKIKNENTIVYELLEIIWKVSNWAFGFRFDTRIVLYNKKFIMIFNSFFLSMFYPSYGDSVDYGKKSLEYDQEIY